MASRRKKIPAKGRNPEYVVSACLAGADCTYLGKSRLDLSVAQLVSRGNAAAFCPEVAGGLGVPRENSEITGGDGFGVLRRKAKVLSRSGKDFTSNYARGARIVLKETLRRGIRKAILKSKSPACGVGHIYDGTFSGKLKNGHGVLAAALAGAGIGLQTEHDFKSLKKPRGDGRIAPCQARRVFFAASRKER